MKYLQRRKLAGRLYGAMLLAVLMGLSMTGLALAQGYQPGAVTDDQVNAVARQLYCPVCENIPLDVCGTQACAQWRELVREKLGQGWNEGQIKDYFAAQYGDRVLGVPPPRGLNWLVYLPIFSWLIRASVVIGIILLYMAFRARKKSAITEQEAGPPPDQAAAEQDEYEQRLEEELSNR